MNDSRVLNDPNESPENSSTPHSWTRQHGSKHRDFPAARLQARERARLRVQRAIQEERLRAREQAKNWRTAGLTARLDLQRNAQVETTSAIEEPETSSARADERDQEPLWPNVEFETSSGFLFGPHPHEEAESRPEQPEESIEESSPPIWLGPHSAEIAGYSMSPVPADTLQGVRDRLASRRFALKGLFEEAAAPELLPESAPKPALSIPVLAVFSLAGGVGKTSLVATLARNLSARGERVLLVETAPFGLLPCFFGARNRRPGVLRTFAPPDGDTDAPVRMIALNADALTPDASGHDPLAAEIVHCAHGAGRVIVDIATASAAVARRVLRMAPMVLVPVVPDMNSVVNVGFIDCLFHRKPDPSANFSEVYYVLNQFDPSLPLHLDVREVLRERLGDRLLPFALRSTPAISEAHAEGMTLVDYAPASAAAEDFNSLAAWVKARSAPAGAAARGKRWTEK